MENHIQQPTLREAKASDTSLLRACFEMASDGLAPHFWAQSCKPGQTLDDVAQERMAEKISNPDVHVWVAGDGQGAIATYDIGVTPESLDGNPPIVQPLVILENQALGTHYINMLAVLPQYRRQGLGDAMIARARELARGRQLSLIVSDENAGARRLYERAGFGYAAREPQISNGWNAPGEHWLLMVTES